MSGWWTRLVAQDRLTFRQHVVLLGVCLAYACFMVFGGQRVLASAARAVLGDDPLVHLVAGAAWTTVAAGLLVDVERLRHRDRRWVSRVGWTMALVGWFYAPVSRLPNGSDGTGGALPSLTTGLLLALPAALLGWGYARRPGWQAREIARETTQDAGRARGQERAYRRLLEQHGGDVDAVDDLHRQEHLQRGTPLPARPPELEVPDTSATRFDLRGNRLPRRTVLRRRR